MTAAPAENGGVRTELRALLDKRDILDYVRGASVTANGTNRRSVFPGWRGPALCRASQLTDLR